MPRKPTGDPPGHPLIPIDWTKVEQMIQSGCNGVEIYSTLKIKEDTFYDRFKREYGVGFSELRPKMATVGHGMIRMRQFKSAMQGNTQMLKTLGEEWLKQGRKDDHLPPNDAQMDISLENVKLLGRIQELEAKLELKSEADPVVP
jgi:hypothetical protein